jgi:predicted LPLAT superfamily acyltransferase
VSTSWKTQRERGSNGALRLILWIALHLGRSSARLVLYPITLYFLITGAKQRKASRRFLSRALGRRPSLLDITRHIHSFAATILDRVFLLTDRQDCFDVRLHQPEIVRQHIGRQQGCILLGSHLGSFEVLRALATLEHGIPLKILMYPQHNEKISRIFAQLNPDLEKTIIPLGRPDTLIRAEESISEGYIVGLLGDRISAKDKTTSCRFLGEAADFPEGPMLLAAILKVPVVLFFGLYRGGNRYDIHFEAFADRIHLKREQRSRDLQEWTQRYVDRLEAYSRQAPYNWFNFYDFWNEDEKTR